MTKTLATALSQRFANANMAEMIPPVNTADGSFVWNFEFGSRAAQALPQRQRLRGECAACWDLFEIWLLVLEIFIISIKHAIFVSSVNYLFKLSDPARIRNGLLIPYFSFHCGLRFSKNA
jgi:hypothetical protein